MSELINRDKEIGKYCSDYYAVFNQEYAQQFYNNPLVEDPDNAILGYSENEIAMAIALYKSGKKEDGLKIISRLITGLKNGLITQSKSIEKTGYLIGGIHTLGIYELVMVINDLNLLKAKFTDSRSDYELALNDFNQFKNEYPEYLSLDELRLSRYGSSLLAQEATILAGLGKLEDAEAKFDQAFEQLPFESLPRLHDYENVLIQQKKYEKALEISDFGISLNILGSWNNSNLSSEEKEEQLKNEPKLTINDIKRLAKSQQTTLVKYSLHDDDKLLIWVITPDGNIYFRQVNFTQKFATKFNHQSSFTANISKADLSKGLIFGLLFFILIGLLIHNSTPKLILVSIISFCVFLSVASCNSQHNLRDNNDVSSFDLSSFKDLIQVSYSTLNTRNGESSYIPDVIRSISTNYCENSEECLEKINRIIIEPIANLLPSNPDEHIVFIPDGNLFKVPFAALRDNQGKYLIEKHTIRYAPSLKILKIIYDKAKSKYSDSPPVALIVGNPIMPTIKIPAIDERREEYSEIRNIKPHKFEPLKYSETEAREIAKIYQTQPLIGKYATGKAVLEKINNADIIHLATHGFYSETGDSLLILTPTREPCLKEVIECEDRGISYDLEDGFLESNFIFSVGFSERYNFKAELKANLVVLSACNTGLAGFTNYNSFPNKFMQMGVPSVLVSLWPISDNKVTAELMIDFHRNLQENPDKAKALRQVMLDTMKNHENPSLWSAFILFGSQ